MNKIKRVLIVFPVLVVLCVSVFSIPASAIDFYHKENSSMYFTDTLSLSGSDFYSVYNYAASKLSDMPDVDISSYSYVSFYNPFSTDRCDYYVFFIENESNSFYLDQNSNYIFTLHDQSFVVGMTITISKHSDAPKEYPYRCNGPFDFSYNLVSVSDPKTKFFPTNNTAKTPYLTNMKVNGKDDSGDFETDDNNYLADVNFSSGNTSVNYTFENLTKDKKYMLLYGVEGLNVSNRSTDVAAGESFSDSIDVSDMVDYANDKDVDLKSCSAFMSIYDGIDCVEVIRISLEDSQAEDGLFDDKKEYEDFPDIEDYFQHPPEFPDLEPFPDFPGWDSDHPWESLKDILLWIGQCIITPFKNLWLILKWIVSTIVYYLTEIIRYLKDCFLVLVHNIGVALYNLMVDLKSLFKYLFIPKAVTIKNLFKEKLPIYDQLSDAFNSVSAGTSSITINLFNRDVVIDPVSSLGSRACSILYAMSTVIIYAITAFGLFNYITSVFGISSSGGDS